MKRVGNLWPEIVSTSNLFAAAKAAAAGKRSRPDVAKFLVNLEPEVFALRRELESDAYRPGPYRTFIVREPKRRMISAAPFRDRVVHHALTRVLEPVFERSFTKDSYACRKGFGTHHAIAASRKASSRYPFVLKCDIVKYFPTIDHQILCRQLGRVVKCAPTLKLAATIVDGSNLQDEVIAYFPEDTLFSPFERRRGLPLGNQTSQFFANVYLNPLDHFVRRRLRPGDYMRYVDDFLLFGRNKRELAAMRCQIEEFLCELRLRLHPGKSRVYRTGEGVTFLGWRIFPDRMRLTRANVVQFRRRLRTMQRLFRSGAINRRELEQRIRAWIAHAAHGQTWKLRESIFGQCPI